MTERKSISDFLTNIYSLSINTYWMNWSFSSGSYCLWIWYLELLSPWTNMPRREVSGLSPEAKAKTWPHTSSVCITSEALDLLDSQGKHMISLLFKAVSFVNMYYPILKATYLCQLFYTCFLNYLKTEVYQQTIKCEYHKL